MIVFDASILLLFLDEHAPLPRDAATGDQVPQARARVEYLIDRLSDAGDKIIIPTPALSEVLVWGGSAGPKWLALLNKQSCFRVAEFGQRAAIEVAATVQAAKAKGDKRSGNTDASWAKCKFDRQIVAIGRVEGATSIYSDDKHVISYAKQASIEAYRTIDLPLPPEDAQPPLPFA